MRPEAEWTIPLLRGRAMGVHSTFFVIGDLEL